MDELSSQLQRMISSQPKSRAVESRVAADEAYVTPFLRWAGGKRWLVPLARQMRAAPINRYFEPFLGSAAMFFGVRPKTATLSDCNEDLINTYRALKTDWRAVVRKLREHDRNHCEDYYYQVRDQRPIAVHTRAARFIYLNRTCWNGLYRVNKDGIFNTPVGTKQRAILPGDNFEEIASRLRKAKIVCGDFEAQIDEARRGDLIFADPPYTVRHQYNGFLKYNEDLFSWEDQERLCAALIRAKKRGAAVICTNADHKSIRDLYGSHFRLTPRKRFSAIAGLGGARGKFAELIISV